MITVTYGSVSCYLLPYQPDWASSVVADFQKQTVRTNGLSNRENREEMSDKLVTTLKWSALINATEAAALRSALASWDNRPILVPFWPCETKNSAYLTPSVQGAVRIWYEPDWSRYEINSLTAPTGFTPTANCRVAPLLFGRFTDFPTCRVLSGNDVEAVQFEVIEDGYPANALEPKSVTLTNGVSVNGLTVPMQTVPFTWGSNEAQAEVRIKRDQVGFGRKSADTFYAQAPRTISTLYFAALQTAELAYILKLFRVSSGSVKPFWTQPAHSLLTGQRVYGRFLGDKLSVSWDRPALNSEIANLNFEFISLPTESTIPGGETFAATIGPMPARWFGYEVTCGSQVWRFTSYESDIVGPSANVFTAAQISHGTITEEINLAVNDCTLTVHAWTGCPFTLLVQQITADPMTVTIYEGNVASPSAAVAIYTGTAMAPKTTGQRMMIKLRGPAFVLSIQGPRPLVQETCAAVLGDSRCTKNLAAFTVTANLLSLTSGVGEVNVAGSGYADGYFRNGYAERTVGSHVQRVMIADSYTLPGSGHLGVVFASTIAPAPTGVETGWVFVAGCDGYYSTCGSKFSNTLNFRGCPRLPATNPSIVPLPQNTAGKKH